MNLPRKFWRICKSEFDRETLEEIVRMDGKQRYSFNEDKTLIRANQGHSLPVDVELEEAEPPEILWYGTGQKYVRSIEKNGLKPQGRRYVHLFGDRETARKVGQRHGCAVLYRVCAGKMQKKGNTFYRSKNGVWLIKMVPAVYLEKECGIPTEFPIR